MTDAAKLKDNLTGLNNIIYLEEVYYEYINKEAYIIAIDFRNLKYINDHFGHDFGDEALRIFADQLRLVFNGSVLVRRSGDEFFILTDNNRETTINKIKLMDENIRKLNNSGNIPYAFTFNCGIIKAGSNYRETLRNSDLTMYDAKQNNQLISIFTKDIVKNHEKELKFIGEIDNLLDNNRFNYKSEVIDHNNILINDIKVVDHKGEPIFDSDKTNMLAKNYRIEKLDLAILKDIISKIVDTRHIYMIDMNHRTLFSREFNYIDVLDQLLKEKNMNSNNICININTDGYTGSTLKIVDKIKAFKEMGVKISIGEITLDSLIFSPTLLALAPIDYVKFDYEMVSGTENDPRSREVIKCMSDLLDKLDITPIFVNVDNIVEVLSINPKSLIKKK